MNVYSDYTIPLVDIFDCVNAIYHSFEYGKK